MGRYRIRPCQLGAVSSLLLLHKEEVDRPVERLGCSVLVVAAFVKCQLLLIKKQWEAVCAVVVGFSSTSFHNGLQRSSKLKQYWLP